MKKENKNKSDELFEAFLPDRTKDDPNENLKKEKKLYSIIFVVVCALLLVANLIAMIINFCVSIPAGFSSLFVGFINCTISIFLLGLLIVMAHNISKMTRATLFMCSKLMKDEKRLQEAEKNKSKLSNVEETQEESSSDNSSESVPESVDAEQVNDFDESSSEEVTTLSVDIIADED